MNWNKSIDLPELKSLIADGSFKETNYVELASMQNPSFLKDLPKFNTLQCGTGTFSCVRSINLISFVWYFLWFDVPFENATVSFKHAFYDTPIESIKYDESAISLTFSIDSSLLPNIIFTYYKEIELPGISKDITSIEVDNRFSNLIGDVVIRDYPNLETVELANGNHDNFRSVCIEKNPRLRSIILVCSFMHYLKRFVLSGCFVPNYFIRPPFIGRILLPWFISWRWCYIHHFKYSHQMILHVGVPFENGIMEVETPFEHKTVYDITTDESTSFSFQFTSFKALQRATSPIRSFTSFF